MSSKKTTSVRSDEVKTLHVEYTGLRSNEILFGIQQQSQGAMIEIRFADSIIVPPKLNRVQELLNNVHNDVKIRDQFQIIPFFASMGVDERKKWLQGNAKEKLYFFQQYTGCEIRFIRMGGKVMIEQVSEEDRKVLMEGAFHPVNDIIKMIRPKNPGSKAAATTMLFRADNWKITTPNAQSQINALSEKEKHAIPRVFLTNEIPTSLSPPTINTKDSAIESKTMKKLI